MRKFFAQLFVVFIAGLFCSAAFAAERIELPLPAKSGGPSLLETLSARQTSRTFADADLTPQQLSNLLWAAAGVNRPDGRRTYPVAMGRQDMSVYVFLRDGVYRYLPGENALELAAKGDHRADSGAQPFVGTAAVNLAYVQDVSLWQDAPHHAERAADWGFAHTGAMMQNAYLYAASQGWSAVVRGMFDGEKLSALLKLNDAQVVRLVQTIGPKP